MTDLNASKTSKDVPLDDPRVQEAIRTIRVAQRELPAGEKLSTKSLSSIRKNRPELGLMSVNAIYQVCSFIEAIKLAKVDQDSDPSEDEKEKYQAYYDDMLLVARKLGVRRLSTPAYDKFRRRNPKLGLISSSAIRRHCGFWEEACKDAGLLSPNRSSSRKPTRQEMIFSGKMAWRALKREMDPASYREFCMGLDAEMPSVEDILNEFRSWESFCREAKIEVSDDVDPSLMWSQEEVKRVAKWISKQLDGKPINEKAYNELKKQYPKRIPEWSNFINVINPPKPSS